MLLSSILVVSCDNDDDDDNGSSIVGVWVSEKMPLYVQHQNELVVSPTETSIGYYWYKEDGTFVEADVITNSQTNYTYTELSENGKWSVVGDNVIQSTNFYENYSNEFYTDTLKFKVSGNTLYINYIDPFNQEATAKLQRTTVEKIQEIISSYKNRHNRDVQ